MQNKQGAVDHFKNHQKYPASSDQLLAECDNLSDFSDEDKGWFKSKLPMGKTFNSAEEVMMALGLTE